MRDQLRVSEEVRRVDSGSIGARSGRVTNTAKLVFELETCNEMRHHEKVSFFRNDRFSMPLCTRVIFDAYNMNLQANYRFDVAGKKLTGPEKPTSTMRPSRAILNGR